MFCITFSSPSSRKKCANSWACKEEHSGANPNNLLLVLLTSVLLLRLFLLDGSIGGIVHPIPLPLGPLAVCVGAGKTCEDHKQKTVLPHVVGHICKHFFFSFLGGFFFVCLCLVTVPRF